MCSWSVLVICRVLVGVLAGMLVWAGVVQGQPREAAGAGKVGVSLERAVVEKIVVRIVRADYEGDRPELRKLFAELEPYAGDAGIGARVRYWRGFALWRRAINGFNESVDGKEQEADLTTAAGEFEKALAMEPGFVDAKLGAAWCWMGASYMLRSDATKQEEYARRGVEMLREARTAEPENPRGYWHLGLVYWNVPVDLGGGQGKSKEAYERGLELARKQKGGAGNVLVPTWGEPELLMSLAWVNLNKAEPDLETAEKQAREALALVPHWHYVKNILMKQIQAAKEKKK